MPALPQNIQNHKPQKQTCTNTRSSNTRLPNMPLHLHTTRSPYRAYTSHTSCESTTRHLRAMRKLLLTTTRSSQALRQTPSISTMEIEEGNFRRGVKKRYLYNTVLLGVGYTEHFFNFGLKWSTFIFFSLTLDIVITKPKKVFTNMEKETFSSHYSVFSVLGSLKHQNGLKIFPFRYFC